MGCMASSSAAGAEGDAWMMESFVSLAREDTDAWADHRRTEDGPRGSRIESKAGPRPGVRYWRGTATVRAPIDIVLFFLRNQAEFNSLQSTIDYDVLGSDLARAVTENQCKVVRMKDAGHARQVWRLQMPAPLLPRLFVVDELMVQRPDGAVAIVCRNVSAGASGSGPGRGTLSKVSSTGASASANNNKSKHKSIMSLQSLVSNVTSETGGFDTDNEDEDDGNGDGDGDGDCDPTTDAEAEADQTDNEADDDNDDGASSGADAQSTSASVTASSTTGNSFGRSSNSLSKRKSTKNKHKSGVLVSFSAGQSSLPSKSSMRLGRGECIMSGYLLEPVAEGRYTKVTFLSCLDPTLSESEVEAVTAAGTGGSDGGPEDAEAEAEAEAGALKEAQEAMETVLGMARILTSVESPRRHFEDPKTIWAEQLFRLASAEIGEFGFVGTEATQYGAERLQTGTHVTGAKGHGIIKNFDLRGRATVVYDNGKEKTYSPKEVETHIKAAVEPGTRVKHAQRGLGTVKQFDDKEGKIHVKFDNGAYHRYNGDSWKEKIKVVKQGDMYGNVRLSKCQQMDLEGITKGSNLTLQAGVTAAPLAQTRRTLSFTSSGKKKAKAKAEADSRAALIDAEALRITFNIGAPTAEVLDYILNRTEDEKAGNLLEDTVLKQHTDRHQTRYQRKRYPQNLNDRDFVFDSFWHEVEEETFVVVHKSTHDDDTPPRPSVVRGNLVIQGFLLEPLYDTDATVDTRDFATRVTYVTCVEPGGFVPPKIVATQNRNDLIGVLTDMRSYFFQQNSRAKARRSRRVSGHANDKLRRRSMRRKTIIQHQLSSTSLPGT